MKEITDKQDALRYLHNYITKDRPDADMPDFAKQAIAEYRERKKLIK